MQQLKGATVFLTLFSLGIGLNLPSNIQICKRSDADVNRCLEIAIEDALRKLEKGLPEFGMGSIKPLNVPSMTIGEGTGAVHVVQKYKNVHVFGITDAKVEKVNFDIKEPFLDLKLHVVIPNIKLIADYDLNGRILVLPVNGNGKCTIQLKNTKSLITMKAEEFEKDGEKYLEVKDLQMDLNPTEMIFNFENLFNGDDRLGAEMNKLLNDNWKEIFADIKSGYEESFSIIFKNVVNLIFTNVPYTDLFPL